MNGIKMPTDAPTVESDFQKELKKETEVLTKQEGNEAKPDIDTVIKESEGELSPKSWLKRKVKEEQENEKSLERLSKRPRKDSKDNIESVTDSSDDFKSELLETAAETDEVYSLLVSNFPETWSFPQICNYVSQSLEGVSVEMEPVLGNNKNELRLTFNSAEHRCNAQNALQEKPVEGNLLQVVVEGPALYDNDSVPTEEIPNEVPDIWEVDPKGLYGLKPEYLRTLNITPPIGNWLHVKNFRCDKSELRDALELAGNVVACSVVNIQDRYAKIMYSHPLEAVQAISMLNDQIFYGMKLSVAMDKVLNSQVLLPKGLAAVGPGLGEDGYALRDLPREYERFLNGKSSKINQSLFTAGNVDGIIVTSKNDFATIDSKVMMENKLPTNPSSPKTVSKPNPTSAPTPSIPPNRPIRLNIGNTRPQRPPEPSNYRFPRSPMFRGAMHGGPMMGRMGDMGPPGPFSRGFASRPSGRMPMPFGPRPPPRPMPPAGPITSAGPIFPPGHIHPPAPMPVPMPGATPNWPKSLPTGPVPIMSKCTDATTLKISHLPPTTSFPSLCGKLSSLAQVTSLEFTTPGCAIVKFASPSDAEKCFQNYRSIELF